MTCFDYFSFNFGIYIYIYQLKLCTEQKLRAQVVCLPLSLVHAHMGSLVKNCCCYHKDRLMLKICPKHLQFLRFAYVSSGKCINNLPLVCSICLNLNPDLCKAALC